jgi:nuclear pore complex protein Nup93
VWLSFVLCCSRLKATRNYLLAQAHVDVSALSNSIAHLNPATTFSPLQPLQDTDVAGYLRVAHEQNLISTIEEGRKETQEEFYRVLEERCQRDWDLKKKRVFEELGGKVSGMDNRAVSDLRSSTNQRSNLMVCFLYSAWSMPDIHHLP